MEQEIVFVGYFQGTEVPLYKVVKVSHPLEGQIITEQQAIVEGFIVDPVERKTGIKSKKSGGN